uniref:Kinesin-like protein n=1 Tax=Sphenodon punctatus TaxID=8508 RepID=A0A8D0H2E4_SPHPU
MVPVPPADEGNVAVVVRVRPQNQREQESNRPPMVQVISDNVLVFDPEESFLPGAFPGFRGHDAPKRKAKDLKFVFDQVFGERATQQEVFQHTTKQILDGVLNGYNCSVFAYGATGAGKTHTMLGSEKDPGIMYLTMVELYKEIEARKDKKHCEVLISYQEVYNEQIHDLLEPKGPLAIREDPEKGVVVPGLSFHQPKSAEQLLEMLASGNRNRTKHPTDANATSSRSHAIFQIHVKQQDHVVGLTQDLQMAKMSLIDLAGSERASTTNARGKRLREGANINRSLLALINVINALADAKSKKPHIPYRDSKLTRLLKDSIGGNCRTVMIAAISPSVLSCEDTYNTLKYANRAKEIKLSLKSNVVSLDCHISQYVAVCGLLKAEVADLREKLRAYEEGTLEAGRHVWDAQASSSPQLVTAILRVAQRQYSLLKAASLLPADMVSEFEELERQACGENCPTSPPQALLPGEHTAPVTRSMTRGLQEPMQLPSLPRKKRLRSEMSSGPSSTPKRQAKRRRKACPPGPERDSSSEWAAPTAPHSHSTPIARAALCTPKLCPSTVTKGRVPLATSAAQNCATPAAPVMQDLNVTFNLPEESCVPGLTSPLKLSAVEFPGWENVQGLSSKRSGPFIPRASMPVFTQKGSSIPRGSILKLSSSAQKRRRAAR